MEKYKEANVYIQEKGITVMFEEMMAGLLTTKPDNPVSYLIQHLKNRSSCDVDDLKNKKRKVDQPLIFMLGGPGSGKGSQCACIVRDFGYVHYSAGDLLRREIKSGSEKGKEIQAIMEDGRLVPSEWTVELLKNAVKSAPDAKGYLIDGFPRNIEQGLMFEDTVRPCDIVLVLECSEEIMMKRILDRAGTSGRVDDNETTLRKRFASNTKDTLPVIEYYKSIGKVYLVDSERSIDDVHSDMVQILKNI